MVVKLKTVYLTRYKYWQTSFMENVYIAKLGKSVGLKGEIKIFLESDFPSQFKKNASFTTNKNITLIVESFNEKRAVIKFFGINDIDAAKRLTNTEIYTTIEDTKDSCALEDDQFFWFDIKECQVIENEIVLGLVSEIHRYPLSDYLEVITSKDLLDKSLAKTFLIPYNKEYILSVNINEKEIIVKDSLIILENS